MFNIISPDTDIDFTTLQGSFLTLSGIVLLACVVGLFIPGPNFGIDFKGGTELIIQLDKKLNSEQVREAFHRSGSPVEQVQRYGSEGDHEWLVQMQKVSVVGPKTKDHPDAEPKDVTAEEVVEKIKGVQKLKDAGAWLWNKENPNRMEVTFPQDAQVQKDRILSAIGELGLKELEMEQKTVGGLNQWVFEFQGLQRNIERSLQEALPKAFDLSKENVGIKRMESVGPRAGKQLRNSGILSVLVALFCILVYVGFRFDLRYAPGAVAALTHDVIIAVGFFTFTQLEITLPIIAALLTIVGYSLNDTIVVFDRIRENLESTAEESLAKVSNTSINETLSRTINTSLTTLLAVTAIAILGGGLIQNFAIALIVGVIVGTYSSVFVATPIMLKMDEILENWREAREETERAKSSGRV